MRSLITAFAFAVCFTGSVTATPQSLLNSEQALVVTSDSWKAPRGTLSVFERAGSSSWKQRGSTIDVRLGRAGMGLGRGIVDTRFLSGPRKREGDDRAPAGIFRLGSVLGSRHETKMPFVSLSKNTVAVDDPRSRYYNRIVDASKIDGADWKHAEKLFGVDVYKLGIEVEHNVPPKSGAGSCIFLHVWKDGATSTSGCTAMSERDLIRIVQWLDPKKHPLLVQLPRPVYAELRGKWNLP